MPRVVDVLRGVFGSAKDQNRLPDPQTNGREHEGDANGEARLGEPQSGSMQARVRSWTWVTRKVERR
jgi:hypothetical protein